MTPSELEKTFKHFNENLTSWLPDGVIPVGLESLCDMGLLNKEDFDEEEPDDVTQLFHVEESADKITLHNEKFAIWIVPMTIDETPTTHTYISQFQKKKPHLELVFSTAGVYNTPKFILKVLQHFLLDVIDTDAVISSIDKKKD